MQNAFAATRAATAVGKPGESLLAAGLLWVGFILVSLNLRLIFATVGPLLKNLELGGLPPCSSPPCR